MTRTYTYNVQLWFNLRVPTYYPLPHCNSTFFNPILNILRGTALLVLLFIALLPLVAYLRAISKQGEVIELETIRIACLEHHDREAYCRRAVMRCKIAHVPGYCLWKKLYIV